MRESIDVIHHKNVEEACAHFHADIEHWINHCIELYGQEPPSDVHDQATYTTSWRSHLSQYQHQDAVGFLARLRDDISGHFQESGQWHHGYWKKAEAHHGTEHTELFLGSLIGILPDNRKTEQAITHVAEHVGNWCSDVPDWFNWNSGMFRSLWQGTEHQTDTDGVSINVPDHLRLINISLLAYDATGEPRYLSFAEDAVGPWVRALISSKELPVAISESGPVLQLDDREDGEYRAFAGQAPPLISDVDRAENFLASNGVWTFLKVWEHLQDDSVLQVSIKLLDVISRQLEDPDAGAASAVIRQYRSLVNDGRYDAVVLGASQTRLTVPVRILSVDTKPLNVRRASGIGKRSDMPRYFEDGAPRMRTPLHLALAAEINDDEAMATQAVDLARSYFNLSRRVFPDGRSHGCAAQSVSAVARGHGRDNNAGMITAVLDPVKAHFCV